jgi:hypothetical protein
MTFTSFVEACPACATPRVGAFRFCLACRLDYDHPPAAVPPPARVRPLNAWLLRLGLEAAVLASLLAAWTPPA